jgi:hypothetical protein
MPDATCIPCPVIKKKKKISALITFLVLKKGKKKKDLISYLQTNY